VPFETIRIEDNLDGGEADVLAPLKLGKRLAVVSDTNTVEAMGRRVAKHLKGLGAIEEIVLPGNLECDEPTIATVMEKTRTPTRLWQWFRRAFDVCNTRVSKDGRRYGPRHRRLDEWLRRFDRLGHTPQRLLRRRFRHAPRGIFIDLKVRRSAPLSLGGGACGDSLSGPPPRSTGGPRTGSSIRSIRVSPTRWSMADEPA